MEPNSLMNEWKDNLTNEISSNLSIIEDICCNINSLDLISYIAFYNHLHNANEYVDNRGDKNFFVSEVIACQCLKNEIITKNTFETDEILESFFKIQEATLKYCGMSDAKKMSERSKEDNIFDEITEKLERESKHIRNPGHPKHHLLFSEKLYKPFDSHIEKIFGFTLKDTIVIRDEIHNFLNERYKIARESCNETSKIFSKETIKFKHKKLKEDELTIQIENIEEIIKLSDQEIRRIYNRYFYNILMTQLSKVWCFTAQELAEFTNLETTNVENFLRILSCEFNSLDVSEEIYTPISILKSKPVIRNEGLYLVPSTPLLNWSVEDLFEREFKKDRKLYGKYISQKHDFLLDESISFFKNILPNGEFSSNMFYEVDDNRYETDGLFVYNDILFIVEAKSNRFSDKAKGGHKLKTEDHLKDIIKDSYAQALRTLKYLKENDVAVFKNKNKNIVEIKQRNFKEIILVSLTLDQLGNIIPIIKTSDKLDYFDINYFPWIVSLYDLIVISDFFETPSLLFYYLKIRKKFLSFENTYIYEELDLIGYFLKQKGNTLSYMIEKERNQGANYFYFVPETDFINNYYMYKFNYPNKFIKKPSYFTNADFKELICKIDSSYLPHSIETSVLLMEYNKMSIDELSKKYRKAKMIFLKDKKLHDCSIFTKERGGFGFTYMVSNNEEELKNKLESYTNFKKKQMFARTWIGVGEFKNEIKFIYLA